MGREAAGGPSGWAFLAAVSHTTTLALSVIRTAFICHWNCRRTNDAIWMKKIVYVLSGLVGPTLHRNGGGSGCSLEALPCGVGADIWDAFRACCWVLGRTHAYGHHGARTMLCLGEEARR